MSTLTGTGLLVRLVLRRDRVRLPLWLLGVGGVTLASAASLPSVYPDQASIDRYAALVGDNPALVAFAGPGHGFDDPTIGVILVNETQLWVCVAAALMSTFLLVRHTRAEEDEERADLLRSSVVGRHAPLAAAVAVVAAANVVLAVACGVGFVALGYEAVGSAALAASFAAFGVTSTGVAAVAAQLASSARAALGLACTALGAAFLVRALGDIGDSAVGWLSPLGWALDVRAFAGERWTGPLLCVASGVVGLLGARALADRRDLGAGILASRPGPARASRGLRRPAGLALRLQRGALVGWAVGLFLTGVVYGSIGDDVEQMVADNPTYADLLTQAEGAPPTESYLATALTLQAMLACGFTISAALRPRGEEAAGRADLLLAGPRSRRSWAAEHLAVAAAGSVVVVAAGGLGVGIAYAAVSGDASEVPRLLGAALVTLPAVAVLLGITVALLGARPGLALAAWAALAVVVVVGLFGELLRLPAWSRDVSPFTHLPAAPAEDLRPLPVVVLVAVAAALVAAGLAALGRRDVGAT